MELFESKQSGKSNKKCASQLRKAKQIDSLEDSNAKIILYMKKNTKTTALKIQRYVRRYIDVSKYARTRT